MGDHEIRELPNESGVSSSRREELEEGPLFNQYEPGLQQFSDRSLLYCDNSMSEMNSSQELFQRMGLGGAGKKAGKSPLKQKSSRGTFNFGGNKYLSNKYSRIPSSRRKSSEKGGSISRPPSNMSIQSKSERSFLDSSSVSPNLNGSQQRSDRSNKQDLDSSFHMRRQLR